MKSKNKKSMKIGHKSGSALILAVVLTSLLALVGVMFVMTARVDKVAASSISENRELNFAVESVIAKISQELVLDVPGMPKGSEDYYDYPDEWNTWLASLEPYKDAFGNYKWQQISDVTGYIKREWGKAAQENVTAEIIEDREQIKLDNDGEIDGMQGQLADADGDGVTDSRWIELDDIISSKGKAIYAAIRVVDNGGMLNVNTAYKFDPNDPSVTASDIDGSSQMQINLADLSQRGNNGSLEDAADDLHDVRCNGDGSGVSISEYIQEVVRRYYLPEEEKYTPFDISDELELRNRFLLEFEHIVARIENTDKLWKSAFTGKYYLHVPVGQVSTINEDDWFDKACYDVSGPNATDEYSYRHIATTYNMDRIINPYRLKMLNINRTTDHEALYNILVAGIDDPNIDNGDRQRIKRRFAQLAANIVDYVDDDIDVTVFDNLPDPEDHDKDEYYGFEAQPFISEVAMVIDTFPEIGPSYFAVELYNPFDEDINLEDFVLELYDHDGGIISGSIAISFDNDDVIEAGKCFVIANHPREFDIYLPDDKIKENNSLKFFGGWKPPTESVPPRDRRRGRDESEPPRATGWQNDTSLRLKRDVDPGPAEEWIYIDKQFIERHLAPADEQRGYGRDARDWHIVYQTLEEDEGRRRSRGSLGLKNDIDPSQFRDRKHNFSFFLPKPISTDPPLRRSDKFVTVGDITRILTIGNSTDSDESIGEQLEQTRRANEEEVRLDLENPYHRDIFQYLTVFDPTIDKVDNDGDGEGEGDEIDNDELKIPGRININTAPWYVIKQLPWVTGKIARAIVAYRDKLENPVDYSGPTGRESATGINNIREEFGFESIGELNFVIGGDDEYSIAEYALDNDELRGFPDLTTDGVGRGDDITDDFEERDIIFSRISNLVTVRSDVFTAYILVRIGANGPQKRVVTILDRSNVYAGNGKVKIVAQHFVPDPR